MLKIGALLHEIGHAWDAENRLNIDPTTGRFGVVKSELFAHCYALDRLAERCLAQTYNMYIEAMKRQSFLGGFESEIASEVLKEHAIRSLVKWQDHIDHAMEYEKSLV